MVLAYSFTTGPRNILSLNHWKGLAIISLFKEAKETVRRNAGPEDRKVEALQTVCEATKQQFSKTIRDMQSQPDHAMVYAKAGYEYTSRLKQNYDEMAERGGRRQPARWPNHHPMTVRIQSWKMTFSSTFVDKYILNLQGKMNCSTCFEEGKRQGIFQRYINGASLKATYLP